MTKTEYESVVVWIKDEIEKELRMHYLENVHFDRDEWIIAMPRNILQEMILTASDVYGVLLDLEGAKLYGIKVRAVEGLESGFYLIKRIKPFMEREIRSQENSYHYGSRTEEGSEEE